MAGETQLGIAQVPIRATLDKLDKDLSGARSKVTDALKGVGKFALGALAVGAAGATAAVATIGPAAIDAASDLSESVSKANIVFGDTIKVIDQFAATSAEAFGISKQAAYESTGTFGNLFVALGLNQDAASDMSVDIVKLAADLASFNNLDSAEVLDKLRSGLVGEAEPLRSLGVNLTEAAVQQRALDMGLAETAKELTPAMKVQARYALILEQTTTAQGDFARTSDGLANTQRILGATFKNISAQIGTALLPGVLNIAKAILPVVKTLLPPMTQLLEKLSPIIASVGSNFASFVTRLVEAGNFQPLLDELGKLGARFWDWLTGPGGATSQAGTMLGSVIGAVSKFVTENWPTISAALADWGKKFWDWLTEPGGAIETAVTKLDEIVVKFTEWVSSDSTRASIESVGRSLGGDVVTGVVAIGTAGETQTRMDSLITSLLRLLNDIIKAQATLIAAIGGSLASGFLEGIVNTIKTEGPEKVKQAVLDLLGPTFMAGVFSTQGKANLSGLGGKLSGLTDHLNQPYAGAINPGTAGPASGTQLNFAPVFNGMTEANRAWYTEEAKRQAENVFNQILSEVP